MKKTLISICIGMVATQMGYSQGSAKTGLSLQVSQAAAANHKQLMQYVWNRTIQIYVNGELKNTVVSAIAFDSAGKPKATEISSTPTSAPKRGIRGDIERSKIKELKDYVTGAVKSCMKYIYMSEGQMLDFFNKATITEPGNVINVQANSLYETGDQLIMVLNQGSLSFVKQSFNTTVNGTDAVTGSVSYKTFSNGLTAVDAGEIDLPAKNMKLMMSNSGFAKKLQ